MHALGAGPLSLPSTFSSDQEVSASSPSRISRATARQYNRCAPFCPFCELNSGGLEVQCRQLSLPSCGCSSTTIIETSPFPNSPLACFPPQSWPRCLPHSRSTYMHARLPALHHHIPHPHMCFGATASPLVLTTSTVPGSASNTFRLAVHPIHNAKGQSATRCLTHHPPTPANSLPAPGCPPTHLPGAPTRI